MGDTVTQCPSCETSFRVSQEQLDIADGRVRCGQCMHVFTALDHVCEPQSSAAVSFGLGASDEPDAWRGVSEEPVEVVQAELEQEPDALELSESDLNDFEFDRVELDGETKLEDDQINEDDLLFDDLGARREQDVVAEEQLRRDALRDSEFNTAFFNSLNDSELEEDDETRLVLPQLRSGGKDDGTEAALRGEPLVKSRDQDSDTRWAMELIDDLHRDKNGDVPAARSIADSFSLDDATELDSFNINGNINRQFDNLGGFADDYNQSYANDFDDARRGSWLWTLGTLLLVLALVAQYVVFNFNTLATDDRVRPVLERACATLLCELPALEDLKKISSEKLVVRSHPDESDALMVDVIITNRAKFAQPFPALELTFSDLRGKVIAKQNFYPSEYLHGELSGMTLMPSRNPIHLELDIADPGSAAINYKLKLVKGYD